MKPAPGSFFLMGMFGFVISAYLTASGLLDASWGFAFSLTFLLMFISAVVSITPSDDMDYEVSLPKSSAKIKIVDTKSEPKTIKKRKRK